MDELNLRFAVWNVCGLNNPARRTAVTIALEDVLASVVCVSESKLQSLSMFDIVEYFGPRYDGFTYLPAMGTAGGVVVAWRSEEVRVLQSRVDSFSVSVEVASTDGTTWWLTAVYGPTCAALKPIFLEELRILRRELAGPWAVAGDFNIITSVADKNTPVVDRRALGMFRRGLNDVELRESPLLGRRFTWSNEHAS
jgi:exonuclease III